MPTPVSSSDEDHRHDTYENRPPYKILSLTLLRKTPNAFPSLTFGNDTSDKCVGEDINAGLHVGCIQKFVGLRARRGRRDH